LQDVAAEENHVTACNYIRQAAADDAELAVLPEYAMSLPSAVVTTSANEFTN